MNIWRRFKAWMDREVDLITQDTWEPCTLQDPSVQITVARQYDRAARMEVEGITLLHKEGRKRWREPVQFKTKPAIVLPIRGRR